MEILTSRRTSKCQTTISEHTYRTAPTGTRRQRLFRVPFSRSHDTIFRLNLSDVRETRGGSVLGLDTIYIQAKRWQNTVPIKEVRDFAGALLSKRSVKGVSITTSSFPSGAHDFVASIDRKIILIDGERLADLMIQFNLGVSVAETILLKELDYDYFGN